MPIPAAVLDILSPLQISGLPARINPGLPLRPRIPGLDALTTAVAEVLADIRLPLPQLTDPASK